MKKAIIAMSGGVDSSVAALLTKETGDECIGATMKLYNNEDIGIHREKTCCSLDDVEDAVRCLPCSCRLLFMTVADLCSNSPGLI